MQGARHGIALDAIPCQFCSGAVEAALMEAYEAERQRRRDEAAKELGEIGLSLPPGWDLLDDEDF
jgi:hypothetical protein